MRRVRVGWRVVKKKVPVYASVSAGLGALAELMRRAGGLRSLGSSHLLNAPVPPDGSVDALIEAEKRSQEIVRQEGIAADAPLVSSTVNPLTELGKALVEGSRFGMDMASGFFLDGVLESIKGTFGLLTGMISSVMHPVRTVRSVRRFVASMRRISFLSRTWQLWKSQIGWYKRTWQSPHYGRAVGKALFEALMIYFLVTGLYEGAESLSWLSRGRAATEISEVEAVEALVEQGEVAQLSAEEAAATAERLQQRGLQVWLDRTTGRLYVSLPKPAAMETAQKLAQVVQAQGSQAEEVQALVRQLARLSTRNGEADVVVLGPWAPDGFYIQQALERNAAFFDTSDEVWQVLKDSGLDPWEVNEAFMEEMEQQGKRFVHVLDLSDKDEAKALDAAMKLPLSEVEAAVREKLGHVPYRYKEMVWLRGRGYRPVQKGNVVEWVKP
jgi:hypothetical protein